MSVLKFSNILLLFAVSFTAAKGKLFRSGRHTVVTNNIYCTEIARDYIEEYPNITSVELFIVASTCEGIVHPMDSGLGGGFQMSIYSRLRERGTYVNSREKSGSIASRLPTKSGRTSRHIGVPSMLKGYQYVYSNIERIHGSPPALSWRKLFLRNAMLAENGFAMSKTFLANLNHADVPPIWNIDFDRRTIRMPTLGGYLKKIANYGAVNQSMYSQYSKDFNHLSKELSLLNTSVSAQDILNYRVSAGRTMKINCLDFEMHTGDVPSSGFVLAFGCKMLERAVRKHDFLHMSRERQFMFRLQVLNYMFSAQQFIEYLHDTDDCDKLVVTLRDYVSYPQCYRYLLIVAAKRLADRAVKQNGLPMRLETRFHGLKLPLKHVLRSKTKEKGTSNVCVSDGYSDLCATSSINWPFGTYRYSNYFGFFYNNQLSDFTFANRINGNRPRANAYPRSSMSPTLFLNKQSKKLEFALGSSGGGKIIPSVYTVMERLIVQQQQRYKRYDCKAAEREARCMISLVPRSRIASTRLTCEKHLSSKLKRKLQRSRVRARFTKESGYSAVTVILNDNRGCYDTRRGGSAFFKRNDQTLAYKKHSLSKYPNVFKLNKKSKSSSSHKTIGVGETAKSNVDKKSIKPKVVPKAVDEKTIDDAVDADDIEDDFKNFDDDEQEKEDQPDEEIESSSDFDVEDDIDDDVKDYDEADFQKQQLKLSEI